MLGHRKLEKGLIWISVQKILNRKTSINSNELSQDLSFAIREGKVYA